MRRSYERLGIYDFGRHLLETNDLDPLYVALTNVSMSTAKLERWLLAYWCFYSAGVASWCADGGENYWRRMRTVAKNETAAPHGGRFERGHERRHFRGVQCVRAVNTMAKLGHEDMLRPLMRRDDGPVSYEIVALWVQRWPLFGPWISFKVADMLERVVGVPVNFSEATVFMFDSPRQSALAVWRQLNNLPADVQFTDEPAILHAVVDHLTGMFAEYKAPPRLDRPVALQEVETVLCKFKSHLSGHYPLYNDIDEINSGLTRWGSYSPTALELLRAMPKH